jgi:hypothetical protein
MKAALLRAEGLLLSNGRVRQFRTARWQPASPKRLSSLAAKAGPAAPKRLSSLAAKAGQRR